MSERGAELSAEAQRSLRLVLANTADVVWLLGPDGVCEWVSPSVTTVLGFEAAQLLGTRPSLLHPDDRDAATLALQSALDRRDTHLRLRVRVVTAEGATRWVDAATDLWWSAQGRLLHQVASWRDVSAQVRAEEAVAASEARYRLLAENAADAVFSTTPDARYTWFSPSVTSLLGWQPEQLYGMRPADLCHPDDVDRVRAAVTSVGASGSANLRARLRTASGDHRWVGVSVHSVLDEDGEPVARAGSYRDIEAEVAAEQALAAERSALRATLDALWDPHVLLRAVRDEGGAIIDFTCEEANPAACDFLHTTRQKLLGARLLDLSPGQRADLDLFERYVACVEAGDPVALHDRPMPGAPGQQPRWLDFSGARSGDGLSLTWRDVTDRVLARQALAVQGARLQAALDSQLEPHVLLRAVRNDAGSIVDFSCEQANPAACDYLALARDDLERARLRDLFPGRVGSEMLSMLAEVVEHGAPLTLDDFSYRQQSSTAGRRLDVRAVRVGDGLSVGWRDVTDRFNAAQRLAASEERFRAAMASAPIGMAVTGLDRSFREVNEALCAIVGRSSDWLLDHSIADLLDPDANEIDRELRGAVTAGLQDHATAEHQMIRSDGTRIWVDHSVGVLRDVDGSPAGFVSQFVDVTQSRQDRVRLQFLASHDPLTGLLNRRYFLDQFQLILRHPKSPGHHIAVLYIDLDNLKPINDHFGHRAGDAVLTAVAHRLRETVRRDDLVARIGGDEFVVALTTIHAATDAATVARKIHRHVVAPVHVDGDLITITLSIGIALAQPGDDPTIALQHADAALYQAKQRGRAQTVSHDD